MNKIRKAVNKKRPKPFKFRLLANCDEQTNFKALRYGLMNKK